MFFALVASLHIALVAAVPLAVRQSGQDAPYSLSNDVYENAITCTNGIQGRDGGVVLLIHGTASTGSESWAEGPYIKLLPTDPNGPGFDVCWIDLPNRSLSDAQISAEYVAYAIGSLSSRSKTGKVSIVGHSQGGGLNPQWALAYWPSRRPLIADYIALAGDFQGTDEGPLYCAVSDLTQGGCNPSIIQQSTGSNYLAAQNSKGGRALVDTTSIYTLTDQIIQNQLVGKISSSLPGATVINLQAVCGAYVVDHFAIVGDSASYGLALDALTHSGTASTSRFDRRYCVGYKQGLSNTLEQGFSNIGTALQNTVLAAVSVSSGSKVRREPALMPYVCEQGGATTCGSQ